MRQSSEGESRNPRSVELAFSGTALPPAALAWGQGFMRESIKRIEPVDQHLNLTWTQAVPEGIGLEAVFDALVSLIDRHESLRTRYDVDDEGSPRQEVVGTGTFAVDVHEVGGDDLDALAAAAAQAFRERRYDLTRAPLLRATVFTRDDRPCLMVVGSSHMATDGWGLRQVRRELAAFMNPARKGEAEDAAWQPSDQREYERTPAMADHSARALDYFAAQFREFPSTMFWRRRQSVETPRYGSAVLDTPTLLAAAAAVYKTRRVTPSSALFAAFSLVVATLTCHDKSSMFVVHSNRNQRNRSSVANYSQTVPIGVDTRPGSFWDLMKDAHRAMLAAYRYATYPPLEQLRIRAEAGNARGIVIAEDCVYNPGWRMTGAQLERHAESGSSFDEPSVFHWGEGADRGLLMYLATSPTSLHLIADTRFIAPEQFETVLRLVEGLVLRAAKEDFDPAELLGDWGLDRPDGEWAFVDGCWVSLAATRGMVAEATGAAAVGLTVAPGPAGRDLLTARLSGLDSSFFTPAIDPEKAREQCLGVMPRWRSAMVPHSFTSDL